VSSAPPPSSAERLTAAASQLAAHLPPLLVEAERVAASASFGVHGRRRSGPGEDFWQFRPYESGDAVSLIDWRRSAKAGPVYVREREWQSAQTVAIWRDSSASMRYRSNPRLPEKTERAAVLALALSLLLVDAGERVSIIGEALPQTMISTRAGVRQWSGEIAASAPTQSLPVPAKVLPAHVRVVAISDFLMPLADIKTWLRKLSDARPGGGHLVHVLDPAERDLPFSGRVHFDDVETPSSVLIRNTDAIRNSYRARLKEHSDSIAELAAHYGWTFVHHATDQPAHVPLIGLHSALSGAS